MFDFNDKKEFRHFIHEVEEELNEYNDMMSGSLSYDDQDDGDYCSDECDNHFGHFGNDMAIDSSRPKSQNEYGSLHNKKVAALNQLANHLIQEEGLLSMKGRVFVYNREQGCYQRLAKPEKFIIRSLATIAPSADLSVKDLQNLWLRISWDPYCSRDADNFNCNSDYVNALNGVVNYKTGEVIPHAKYYQFTYCIQAKYLESEDVYCPNFEQFCKTSLRPLNTSDNDSVQMTISMKRELLLEMIGYICCDSSAGKCALFFKGEPDSGKSVIANFITRLFHADLISNIPLHKLSDRFNKAELFGRKLNVAGEIQGKRLSEISTFKSVTGSDAISAEFKGKDPFSFTPRCKLLFAGNALPGTLEADTTAAFVNRLVVLLFNHSIPKDEQDKELLDKLWAERDSIFTLAINSLRQLQWRNFQFSIPQESHLFLESFNARGNSLQMFRHDCCEVRPEARVHNADLLAVYKLYCKKNGLEEFSKQKLYDMLSGIPGVHMKRVRIDGNSLQGHVGITLNEQAKMEFWNTESKSS